MKRVISLVLVVLMLATLLCACGAETYVCDSCGNEVTQKPIKMELLGEEVKICDECKAMFEELADMFG